MAILELEETQMCMYDRISRDDLNIKSDMQYVRLRR